tara:strand:+ start:189 stop:584 length:396 start_codon:yes stop_codon:yes gene_type:complete
MAHYAKLGIGNKILTVEVVHNDTATSEQAGVDFLNNLYKTNDIWKQTSYNMFGGVHKLGGTPFRKNFACIGFKYDEARDAFIEPKPHTSWTLNETSCLWDAPITKPDDGKFYVWNETLYQSDNTKGWETED